MNVTPAISDLSNISKPVQLFGNYSTLVRLCLHEITYVGHSFTCNCRNPLNRSSAVAEMGDRLATIDMGRKVGRGCCGSAGSPLGHHL